MIYLVIFSIIFLAALIISFLIVRSFKIPSQKHCKTPADHNIPFEEVSIATKNNKHLYGWWIAEKKNAPTIILMHGWGKNVGRLMPYIKNLHGKGFNLLAFDSRNHGSSDKDDFSSMVKFAEDICSSIDFIEKQPTAEKDNIFLIGLSIGGAASIYAAAHDSRIKKIVTIGAPSNPADVMALHIRKKHIPQPIIWLAFEFLQYKIGKRFSEIAAVQNIFKTDAKVYLVHGTDDKVVPFSQAELLMKAAKDGQAQLWAIAGKGHSNCHYEKEFWEKILNFFG